MVFTPSPEAGHSDGFRAVLEENFQKRSLVHVTAGSTVPLLRHTVWLVVRGMVKLGAVSIHGDELLLGLAGPNEPFGEPLTDVQAYQAVALTDTDLLCLSTKDIQNDSQLALGILQAVASRQRQSEAMLALLGLRRIEDRLRGFLELLSEHYGQPCPQGLRLNLRLTHQDLASALSTTRVTVTRLIGALREEGWLQIDEERRLVVSFSPARGARP
ncbi:MAG: Crp/Fnr family transcriptional regulator [Synechococcus sp.]